MISTKLFAMIVCCLAALILVGLYFITRNSKKVEKLLPDNRDEAFVKISNYIDSCLTPFQLEVCNNLINQFKITYPDAHFDVCLLRFNYKQKKDKMIVDEACAFFPENVAYNHNSK